MEPSENRKGVYRGGTTLSEEGSNSQDLRQSGYNSAVPNGKAFLPDSKEQVEEKATV